MTNFPINNNAQFEYQTTNEDDESDLGALLGFLYEKKWLILGVTLVGVILGVATAFLSTPIYKVNALVQIQERAQPLSPLKSSTEGLEGKSPALAEIELFKSRQLLGETITTLNLDIQAKPNYFPIIGEAIARRFVRKKSSQSIADPLFNLVEYAWGGEAIKLDSFSVPEAWLGEELSLVAGKQGQFRLLKDDELILDGEVGKKAYKLLDNGTDAVSILVSSLKSRSGTHFSIMRLAESTAMDELLNSITVTEKGRGTGYLQLTLDSIDPRLAMNTLNKMIDIYLHYDVGTKSADLQKTIEFIDKQLPIIREQIDVSTKALDDYRAKKGSVDLNTETRIYLDGVVESQRQISQLQQKRDELRQKFTEAHPSVETINKNISRLNEQIQASNRKIEALPNTQQVIAKLSRDVKVNTELYSTILDNLLKARVAKEGAVGDAKVIDYAIFNKKPAKPQKLPIIALASLCGLMLGITTAFIRRMLNKGVNNPNLIERQLNIQVLAAVPHSPNQKRVARLGKNTNAKLSKPYILALEYKEDMAIESLRNLRTNMHFSNLESQKNTLMITGPSPVIGKSFVAINFATILADSGKKILLIDADMRKGFINETLAVNRENGLSELITNQITLDQAIHHIQIANFDFIATGVLPPNPSELLTQQGFIKLLETVGTQYDQVIIDSPPVLAVTDAGIIGQKVAFTLLVVKAGQHSIGELVLCTKRLSQAKVKVKGIIFNDYKPSASQYGSGYNSYVYQYNYQKH